MKRALVAIGLAACGGGRSPGESGKVAAQSLLHGLDAAAAERAPWRCVARPGATLTLAHDVPIVIGVVADARGNADALAALHAQLLRAHANVVFAAGGMGTTQPELERTLGALVDPTWTVVALPGARESVPGLRGAVAALHGKGAAIADGGATRLVDLGAAEIATLPGDTAQARLAAGADGCVRDRADIDGAIGALGSAAAAAPSGSVTRGGGTAVRAKPVPRILISTTAPRGAGDASDLAPGGIHAGELDLAAALAAHPVDLIVHPQLGAPTATGRIGAGETWPDVAVAAGVADPTPRYDDTGRLLPPTALLVTVDRSGIRWQSVGADAAPSP